MEDINKLRQERANIQKEIERLDNWTPKNNEEKDASLYRQEIKKQLERRLAEIKKSVD
jgi:hypothetical protein